MIAEKDFDLAGPRACPVCGRPGNCCAERDRYWEALERLADALSDVKVSGAAAQTYALQEAWTGARETLNG